MAKQPRIAIIGSGIAGISATIQLKKNHFEPTVFTFKSREEASSFPLGLLHPATGQKANPAWHYKEAIKETEFIFDQLEPFSNGETFYSSSPILRPAPKEDMAIAFKKNVSKFNKDEIEWLDKHEIEKETNGLIESLGGLRIHKAYTVDGSLLKSSFTQYLKLEEINSVQDEVIDIKESKNEVIVQTESNSFSFDKVILATGASGLLKKINLNDLIHPVKGQLANLSLKKSLPFSNSISGLGYLAQIENEFAFGSTYEHHFDSVDITDDVKNQLSSKLNKWFPRWSEFFDMDSFWSGLRASTKDRKPIVGPIDKISNLYLNLGYGSKGMLWGAYCSKLLINNIFKNEEIPSEIKSSRFLN